MYELIASNSEHPILEKDLAAAFLRGCKVFGEFISLRRLSKKTDPKSSDVSEKFPAAKSDALACI